MAESKGIYNIKPERVVEIAEILAQSHKDTPSFLKGNLLSEAVYSEITHLLNLVHTNLIGGKKSDEAFSCSVKASEKEVANFVKEKLSVDTEGLEK